MKTDLTVAGYIFDNAKLLLIHHSKLDLWLPVGGHIDPDETSDQALHREIKEETGLDVEIFTQSNIPLEGNIKQNLATPFYVNVHSVGDHDHCTFFYVCKAKNPETLAINEELKDFKWVTKAELEQDWIPVDVKNIAKKAFEVIGIIQ